DELHPGHGQLGADDERQDPGGEEEQEAVDDVEDADLLVVDRGQPVDHPGSAIAGGAGFEGRGCHLGSLRAHGVTVTVPFIAWTWASHTKVYSPSGSAGTSYTMFPG